jgi:hypothetical protein
MIFELNSGLFFKYDATTRSWIKLTATGVTIPLATFSNDGAMSAVDLKKLNRLVLPPPLSSIIGTDCAAPFRSGTIGLYSGDKFVGVEGTVKVQNIGPTGELLSQDVPFHIHQHTYGFDFTIDFPELVDDLKLRKQFNTSGRQGDKGDKGKQGPRGPDYILTGPPGDAGADGTAPPCSLTVEPDDLQVEPNEGMTKALVGGKVVFDPDDPLKYKIVFDRQLIGPTGYAANKFRVQDDTSSWVLAVTGDQEDGPISDPRSPIACGATIGAGRFQKIFYIDVEPIVNAIRDRFLIEANIIKTGYQNIVKFWVQTMSDLFDEQKAALCCALERCKSIKKNAEIRNDIESLAASAAGSANVLLHGRNSDEAVNVSPTKTLRQLGYPDVCKGDNPSKFPQYPNLKTGGVSGFKGDEKNDPSPPPPANSGKSAAPAKTQNLAAQVAKTEDAVREAVVTLDPLIHSTLATAVQVPLLAGDYTAVISRADARIDGKHRANAKIQYFRSGLMRSVQFLDKGEFDNLLDAKSAYEGLGLSFSHGGGMVSVWLPSLAPQSTSGTVEVVLRQTRTTPQLPDFVVPVKSVKVAEAKVEEPVQTPEPPAEPQAEPVDETLDCQMSVSHLAWYERSWESGNCCGLVLNVAGQDWIIVKRSFGTDLACGGGESEAEPCIAKFLKTKGHVAFAWPTLDGKTFVPLPAGDTVTFHFDEKLNEMVARLIVEGEFEDAKGNPAGIRHLSYQLMTVLFPAR